MHRRCAAMIAILLLFAVPAAADTAVTVTIDRNASIGASRLELGITHTHQSTDHPQAKPAAVERGHEIIRNTASWQNTHIIGWGPGDIHPQPDVHDWSSLDARVNMMRQLDIPIIITLCTAPGWMKVGGDTWDMEKRVLPEHYDDFADLALKVAQRYPDVKHFQVWNEFKGFWDRDAANRDATAYTDLYNRVYDRLKGYDASLQVGGFYLVISGTGSDRPDGTGRDFYPPIGSNDLEVLDYWLDNKHGADFIAIDRPIRDGQDLTPYTRDELMQFTQYHGSIVEQVRQRTDLPIWYSEYYGIVSFEEQPIAAAYASIYKHMIEAGTDVALLWNPNEANERIPHHLFTDVRDPDGGRITPHGEVFTWIADHFSKGTPLFQTESDSTWIEALASDMYTLLVNKSDTMQPVHLDDALLTLHPFEARLLDASGGFIASTVIPEPHAAIWLAAGSILLIRRRRR